MTRFKLIDRAGTNWLWPAGDTKLLDVFDQVNDLTTILSHVTKRDVCVQAGGACGVWPHRLVQSFGRVVTVEPDVDNFLCLLANTHGTKVEALHGALSNQAGHVRMSRNSGETANCGAGFTVPSQTGIPTIRIDDLNLEACDLICLDVEGAELEALMGGLRTIEQFWPVVTIEEKPLPHKPETGDARRWLMALGYRVVGAVNRDLILCR